jgi:hypothetical protein
VAAVLRNSPLIFEKDLRNCCHQDEPITLREAELSILLQCRSVRSRSRAKTCLLTRRILWVRYIFLLWTIGLHEYEDAGLELQPAKVRMHLQAWFLAARVMPETLGVCVRVHVHMKA